MRPKYEECLDCNNYHEKNEEACDICEDGDMFEEVIVPLNFHQGERE